VSAANLILDLGRRLLAPRVDVTLLLALLLLLASGLMILYSAAGGLDLVVSQGARVSAGLAALWLISRVPPLQLRIWTPWLYVASLVLLMLVPLFGTGRSGRHWLDLGIIYLQPGELLKLTVPMALAAYLHRETRAPGWRALAACALLAGLPIAMIALQPDLGTALLVAASGVFVIFLAGVAWWRIALFGVIAAMAAPIVWTYGLRDFHRARLVTFLNPEADRLGTGWNIIQSKIAVGSGGLMGKGWGEGTQSRLDFLPEHTTDFIVAVFAEEFGLIGMLALLALCLFIVGRTLWIAAAARDVFARLLCGALGLTFFAYVVVNVGMVTGLMPVIGVPMPLLSFGGTSAVTLLASFGIVMSVHSHRKLLK
jgi:rod shape determining protein RodA